MSRRYRRTVSFKRSNVERVRTKYTPQVRAARKELRTTLGDLSKEVSDLGRYSRLNSNASRLLKTRLSANGIKFTKSGFSMDIPENLKATQYKAIQKAINDFRASESSTVRGLKRQVARQREHLEQMIGDAKVVNKLSDKDIYNFNKIWGSKDYENLRDILGSDEIEQLMANTIKNKTGKINFRRELEKYIGYEVDPEMKKSIYNIYKEYIKVNM